jgi:tight adherence protein B
LVYGAIALAVILLVEGVYYLFLDVRSRDRNPNRRLRMIASGRKREDVMITLRREKRQQRDKLGGLYRRFDRLITQAGMTIPTLRFLLVMLALGVGAVVMVLILGAAPTVATAAGLVGGILLPFLFLLIKRKRRRKLFSAQLPEAIDVMVRSLRAGHPLPTSLALVSREMPDPIGSELGIVVDEVTYGIDLEQGLRNMADRTGHAELRFLVVAINIQSKVGGNLAEILGNLAKLIRDRHRMFDKIRALSAEGRFSAGLLSALPWVVAFLANLMAPTFYGEVYTDSWFMYGMGFGVVIAAIGDYIMYRMVNFRV